MFLSLREYKYLKKIDINTNKQVDRKLTISNNILNKTEITRLIQNP